MADIGGDVHITGSDLPQWASETTLEKLLETVEKLTGISEKQKRILDNSLREIKKTGKASPGGGKGLMGNKKEVGLTKALTTGLKEVGHSALDTVGHFDKLGGPLKDFGKALKKSSASMKIGLGIVGGIFGLIGKGIAIYKDNLSVIAGLSDKGLILEDSYLGINRTLAMTGMSLEQFNELTTKYTRVIGQNGLKAFTNMIDVAGDAAEGFHRFGLTTADATEYAAEYLDQQRMVGVFRTALDRRASLALVENIENMTMYSKVLNVSRGDLEAAARTMMTNADLQAELYSIEDPEVRKKAQEAFRLSALQLASMGEEGAKVSEYLTDIAASPNPYGSATYIRLVENGQTELAQSLVAMSNANKRGEKYSLAQTQSMLALTAEQIKNQTAFRYLNGAMKDEAVLRTNLGRVAAEAQVNNAANLKKFAAQLEKGGDASEEAYLKWLKTVDKTSQGAAALEEGANKVRATMDRFIIEGLTAATEALVGKNGLTDGMIVVGKALGNWSDNANKWIDKVKDSDDPIKMITDTIIGGLTSALKWIGDTIVAAILSLTENTVAAKAGRGLSNIAHWIRGTDADAEQVMGGREVQLADAKRKHANSGTNLGPMKAFNNEQILQYDIDAHAARVNRETRGEVREGKLDVAMTEFERRMVLATEQNRDIAKKQLNELTGGAYGRE